MLMKVYKTFSLEIAHFLTKVPVNHPCGRVHGHRIEMTLTMTGPIHRSTDCVQKSEEIVRAFMPTYAKLHRHFLNDIPGLENPTSEMLAGWVWKEVKPVLPLLSSVALAETDSSGVIYFGPYDSEKK